MCDCPMAGRCGAATPTNSATDATYIGAQPVATRAEMAKTATGKSGACKDYVKNIAAKLQELGIDDAGVKEFAALLDT